MDFSYSRQKKNIGNALIMSKMLLLIIIMYAMWHQMALILLQTKSRRQLTIIRRGKSQLRSEEVDRLIRDGDVACISELRMDRGTFNTL
jgi:hypothetical protein